MSHPEYKSDWNPDGYLGFTCSLPPGPSLEEIDSIFFQLDSEVQAVNEPPIAKIVGSAGSLICDDAEIIKQYRLDNYDDQRGFYVEFENNPTLEQIQSVAGIVIDAFNTVKKSYPDAGLTE